jgi:hypothetical protein
VIVLRPIGKLRYVIVGEKDREERNGEVVRDATFWGSKKEINYILGFEGSQAVPARPSGRGSAYDRNSIFCYLLLFFYFFIFLCNAGRAALWWDFGEMLIYKNVVRTSQETPRVDYKEQTFYALGK